MSSDDEHNIYMEVRRIEYSDDDLYNEYEEDIEDIEEEEDLDFNNLSCINNELEQQLTVFMIIRSDSSINMYRDIYSYSDIISLSPIFNKIDIFTKLFDSSYDIDEYIDSYDYTKDEFLSVKFNIKLNDIIDESFTIKLEHSRGISLTKEVIEEDDFDIEEEYDLCQF